MFVEYRQSNWEPARRLVQSQWVKIVEDKCTVVSKAGRRLRKDQHLLWWSTTDQHPLHINSPTQRLRWYDGWWCTAKQTSGVVERQKMALLWELLLHPSLACITDSSKLYFKTEPASIIVCSKLNDCKFIDITQYLETVWLIHHRSW